MSNHQKIHPHTETKSQVDPAPQRRSPGLWHPTTPWPRKGLELCSWATEQVAMIIIPTGPATSPTFHSSPNHNNFGPKEWRHQQFISVTSPKTINVHEISPKTWPQHWEKSSPGGLRCCCLRAAATCWPSAAPKSCCRSAPVPNGITWG